MSEQINPEEDLKSEETLLLDNFMREQFSTLKKSIPSEAGFAVAEKMIRNSLQAMDEKVQTQTDEVIVPAALKGRKLSKGYMDAIGNTPLLPLNNIAEIHSLKCALLAKCEFMNPSGSSKARTAAKIVKAVMQSFDGKNNKNLESPQTKPVLVHSRLGLAGTILARVNGFPSICMGNQVKTQFYSNAFAVHGGFMINAKSETLQTLKDLMPSMIIAEKVKALCLSCNSVISEIKEDLKRFNKNNPKIDMLVCTADFLLTDPKVTCELNKETLLIVVGERPTFSCDFPIAHYYQINSNSKMFEGNQKLLKDGLFCSPKDGAVLHGALQAITRFNLKSSDANVVLVLNESIRPHSQHNLDFLDFKTKKHFDDFDGPSKENWWTEQVVGDIQVKSPGILDPDMQVQEAIRALRLLEHDQAVVQLANPNVILGVTTLSHLESKLEQGTLQPGDTLGESGAIFKKFHVVKFGTRLKDLIRKFFKDRFVCVVVQQVHECVQKTQDIKDRTGPGQNPQICMVQSRRDVVLGILTQFDVLEYIAGIEKHHLSNSNCGWNKFK